MRALWTPSSQLVNEASRVTVHLLQLDTKPPRSPHLSTLNTPAFLSVEPAFLFQAAVAATKPGQDSPSPFYNTLPTFSPSLGLFPRRQGDTPRH
ncbi:hypothetical protein V5799_022024 [Amblyomma americanum]|uniref:Uncharacterized protein n=1 Tax=Amblyomma americanum TaxID=6943 RepID=A0AAQ4FLX0_AMBAM